VRRVPTLSNHLVTVVNGACDDEELAALTVVLLARTAVAPPASVRRPALWRRLESQSRFRPPHSWQE